MTKPPNMPKWVSEFRDRHGKIRWRFRRRNYTHYFKSFFDTEAFWIEYKECLERSLKPIAVGADRTKKGSFSELAIRYYASAEFAGLANSTKSTYRNIIERFRVIAGENPVADLRREDVRRFVAARASTPAAANNFLRMLRILMRFAVNEGLRPDDPTMGVRGVRLVSDGFHSWTDEEIASYERRWRLGTKERLALDLLLYTAQRGSDVRLMGRQHIKDGRIAVRQQKTAAQLEIPIHPKLKISLARYKSDHLSFLATKQGAPYSAKGFQNFVADAAKKAGLMLCAAHGLRKAAARRLAEAGCTASQIASMTGHKTLREVERYTKAASQVRLADDAIGLLTRTKLDTNLANHRKLAKKSKPSV